MRIQIKAPAWATVGLVAILATAAVVLVVSCGPEPGHEDPGVYRDELTAALVSAERNLRQVEADFVLIERRLLDELSDCEEGNRDLASYHAAAAVIFDRQYDRMASTRLGRELYRRGLIVAGGDLAYARAEHAVGLVLD